jgi:hypothetical protein
MAGACEGALACGSETGGAGGGIVGTGAADVPKFVAIAMDTVIGGVTGAD